MPSSLNLSGSSTPNSSSSKTSQNTNQPPKDIIDRLRDFSLFKSAPESFLNKISCKLRPLHASAREFIITEGDEARAMYWILRGSVGIVSLDAESVHAELGPGAFFGEIGILFDRPRTASVQTRSKCLFLVLTADALNDVLPDYPDIEQLIRDEAQERLAVLEKNKKISLDNTHPNSPNIAQNNTINSTKSNSSSSTTLDASENTLKNTNPNVLTNKPQKPVFQTNTPLSTRIYTRRASIGDQLSLESTHVRKLLEDIQLFVSLPPHILHKLALSMEPRSFAPFQNIITQGNPGKDIYFLLHGKVEVIDQVSNAVMAHLSSGAFFGEMAFLSLAPLRTTTVRTISNVDCLVLPEHALDTLCKNYPEIFQNIKNTAQQRINTNTSHQFWESDGATSPIDSLHPQKNTHSSASTASSSSDHGSSSVAELKAKPLDTDPFSMSRAEFNSTDDDSVSATGVGLFSKSWNTTGAFDDALKPPELDDPLDPMDPHHSDSIPDINGSDQPQFKDSFSNDLVSFKQFNFDDSKTQSSAGPHSSPVSSTDPSPATPTISSSLPNFNLNDNSSQNQQQKPISPSSSPDHTQPPLSPLKSQNLGQFSTSQNLHISPSLALSTNPSRRSKSISVIPRNDTFINETEDRHSETGLSFFQDRRRRFSQAVPSIPGVGGMLLHPRVKRVRYSGRRRSSLFNIGPFSDFLQIKIFQHLTIKDLMRLRRVCQHWRQILQTSSHLMIVLDLTKYNTTITDKSIIPITNFAGMRPKVVDISNCFHLTDEGFSYLVNGIGLAKIQVFKMKSVWEVTGMAIMDITVPSIGSDLQEIDLSNCRKVGDATLSRLIGWIVPPQYSGSANQPEPQMVQAGTVVGCQKLRRISLSYCKHITDRSMYHMAIFASDRLESLNLTRCTSITDHGFSYWAVHQFTALTHLCLADCTFLTDKAIMSITSAAKNLQSLVLSFCCALSDVSVQVLALGCPALRSLDLAFCGSAVSDSSLASVALHLFELERLSVRGCIRVTNTGINKLLADSHKLQYLDITQCRNVVPPLNIPPISVHPPPASVVNGSHFSHTAHPAPIPKSLQEQTEVQRRYQVEAHAQAARHNSYRQMPLRHSYYNQNVSQHQYMPGMGQMDPTDPMEPMDQGRIPGANNGSNMGTEIRHPISVENEPGMSQLPLMNQVVPLGHPGMPSAPVPSTATATEISETMSGMAELAGFRGAASQYSQYPLLDSMDTQLLPPQQHVRPFVFIKMS